MGKGYVQTINFDGIAALLNELPETIRKKALRKGLRAGAKVIAEEAKRRVPIDTGALRSSISVKAATRLRNKKTAVGVRIVAGEGDFKGDTFYGSFLEYGFFKQDTYRIDNRLYSFKRGRGEVTWQAPTPFMRPALEAKAKNAFIIVKWAVREVVESIKSDTRPVLNYPRETIAP